MFWNVPLSLLLSVFNIYWYLFQVGKLVLLDICVGAGGGDSMGQSSHRQSENNLWPPMTLMILSISSLDTQPHPTYQKPSFASVWSELSWETFIPTKWPGAESSITDLYWAESRRGVLWRTHFPGRIFKGRIVIVHCTEANCSRT